MRLRPQEVEQIGALRLTGDVAGLDVRGVCADSREVREGSVFVAIDGTTADGHAFVRDAVQRGAVLVVAQKDVGPIGVPVIRVRDTRAALAFLASWFYGHPSRRISGTAVTGTDGKTSTVLLSAAGIRADGGNVGVITTVKYAWNEVEVEASLTTPDPVRLQRTMATMLADGVDHVVMEASSHALDQRRVDHCWYECAVFTGLGRDHLDYHATVDDYARAKMRLFSEMLARSPRAKGAVMRGDDQWTRVFSEVCPVRTYTFSLRRGLDDIYPVSYVCDLDGTRASLATPWGRLEVQSPLVGEHNLLNLMAAVGVGGVLGHDVERVVEGVCSVGRIRGRLELVHVEGSPIRVYVDYAHTPGAVSRVLRSLRQVMGARGRLLVVFGCGGERDVGKRPQMGRAAVQGADLAVVTSDNPRNEDPMVIIGQIVAGIADVQGRRGEYIVEPDRRRAIFVAVGLARPGEVVAILGKGHERYQTIGSKRVEFDDVQVAREALRKRFAE